MCFDKAARDSALLVSACVLCFAGHVYLESVQGVTDASLSEPVAIQCWADGKLKYLPVQLADANSNTGLPASLGPLFPGQSLRCSVQDTSAASSSTAAACTVAYADFAANASQECSPSGGTARMSLRCTDCAAVQSMPAPPAPVAPYCRGWQTQIPSTGGFDDGTPPGQTYAPNSDCRWVISPGYSPISINFTRFDTEDSYDFVWIIEVDRALQTVLQKFSGRKVPPPVVVRSDTAVVEFTSDARVEKSGFALVYGPGPYCSPFVVMSDPQGSVTDGSPDGGSYRPNTQCQWLIDPGYSPIVLTFSRFDLGPGGLVTVYDGASLTDPVLAIFSGTNLPPVIASGLMASWSTANSSWGTMLIVFTSDGSEQGAGFAATYAPLASGADAASLVSQNLTVLIVGVAVLCGLACGAAVGVVAIKSYQLYIYRSYGGRVINMDEFRWVRGLNNALRRLARVRQPPAARLPSELPPYGSSSRQPSQTFEIMVMANSQATMPDFNIVEGPPRQPSSRTTQRQKLTQGLSVDKCAD
ncbi:hypothetical protein WJX72_002119 [[Myrmecia] bisecta]|uniref:CUB domain-containing protein n=1 Tax=[Myrmecia] bisecta TaxID=41462 RepID=A0AAW1PSA6_9CHLO